MVASCSAFGCTARHVSGGKRTFHRFPINAERCKKWIKAIRRKDFKPSSGSYICSDHFAEDAYDESKTSGFCSRRFLKPDAVPSIFAFPENLISKKVKTRKPPLNQKSPQSTAAVEITEAADRIEVINSKTTSSSLKSIKAPTSEVYISSDHFVKKELDESKAGFCSMQYLRPDAVVNIFAFPDQLAQKKVNTHKPQLNQKSSQSIADVENTKSTDHIEVNSSISNSSSPKSKKAPTFRYIGGCVAKPTPEGYICTDHFVEEEFYVNEILRPDAVPSVSAFPYHLALKKVKTHKPSPSQNFPQSDVDLAETTDRIEVINSIPTLSSLQSITTPTIRYVGDCVPKDTDSLTDTKRKLDFVLSAYQLQQKRMKGLMQQCRRMNKRYACVKNALDELKCKSKVKTVILCSKTTH